MCGIFAYLGTSIHDDELKKASNKIRCRGPDITVYERLSKNVFFGFHRLCIVDQSEKGNQPMHHPLDKDIILISNAEIYNHKFLRQHFGIVVNSGSDCEIILHLYKLFGIKKTVRLLDGVFAFVLYDRKKDIVYACRDKFGIRPMFIGYMNDNLVGLASEAKSLQFCDKIYPFYPGVLWNSSIPNKFPIVLEKYYNYNDKALTSAELDITSNEVYDYLDTAVKKRMMSDRPIGCLLSGGLDSSVITALVCKHSTCQLKTFSIGLAGSTDLKFAKIVAKHLNTDHHSIEFTESEGIDAIPDVIYSLESYDITTVRASVGMYLLSKYIAQNTNIKVIFSGEGSDEIAQGYIYFHNAPNNKEAHDESVRLVEDLYLYDVLRSDRSTAAHGLEIRVPFLDTNFSQFYMNLPASYKAPNIKEKCEKYLLRKAFDRDNLLPEEVLWRPKEAFSDGVSGLDKSWYKIIQAHTDKIISDKQLENASNEFPINPPLTKEAYWYRSIYSSLFKNNLLIEYYWMPKWTESTDPSARSLKNYKQ